MNERDRGNLAFIMSLTPKAFDEWMKVADDDDIMYALELIQAAKLELTLKSQETIEDTTEATAYLKKFRLNPNTPTA